MNLLARLAPAAVLALPLSLVAATISGNVIDKTTNKPAAGDTAILLDLQQSMTEAARTTIDAQGHFSFSVPDNAGMHLVQVEHQKASYYGPVPPNTSTVNIDVYDVSPKVEGLHVYADVERIETDSQGLNVTESFFIRNESKPPKTQFGPRSFEFYLPQGAKLEGATATGPGGMAVSSSPVPLAEKGHYTFVFPVRPGETRFQIGYGLPYSGSLTLHTQVSLPTENLAVMLPKSMVFSGTSFQLMPGDASGPGTETYLATNVKPDVPVSFTVSGTGSMPREAQNGQGGADQGMQSGQEQSAAPANAPGGGLGTPIDTPDPLQKYKWWILSAVGLALVVVAAFTMRSKPGSQPATAGGPPAASPLVPTPIPGAKSAVAYRASLPGASTPGNGASQKSATLAALKDELFSLETERLEGRLSETEYTQLKSALEVVLRRALARETVSR